MQLPMYGISLLFSFSLFLYLECGGIVLQELLHLIL
jgi:hypothetical protein